MKRLLLLLSLCATSATAVPLQPSDTWGAANPGPYHRGTPSLLTAKGTTDNQVYVLEVDPTTGAIPVSCPDCGGGGGGGTPSVGRNYVTSVRNVYSSVPVTTGAWVQLIASTASQINDLEIFDSCGQTEELGVGAAGLESRVLLLTPGGFASGVPLLIPSGSRVSMRAVSADCTTGEIDITALQ